MNRIRFQRALFTAWIFLFARAVFAEVPRGYLGIPFDDRIYRVEQQVDSGLPLLPFRAFKEGVSLWDGTRQTNGLGWIQGATTEAYFRIEDPDTEGNRPVHFHASTGNYRAVAFGWDWTQPQEKGIEPKPFAAISFSLKITGPKKMQELFFGLNRGGAHWVSIRPLQPSLTDGAWHRVTIPFSALKRSGVANLPTLTGIEFYTFVWNASDFEVFLDHIRVEQALTTPQLDSPGPRQEISKRSRGQRIPGKLECAFFDLGGEGVAYHDTTPINTLSGVLNQQPLHQRPHATAYHWNFRKDEGVDISYAKDFADLNHPNPTDPPINQLYIGSTEDGEWVNYTVDVARAGNYRVFATYGNIAGMKPLRFSIDGQPAAELPLPVVTTSMHRWTREEVGSIQFPRAGIHLLTLYYHRGYNLGSFEFVDSK